MGAVSGKLLFVLVAGCLLAGCLAPPPAEDATKEATDVSPWRAIEALPLENVTFPVMSRGGGNIDVAGYAWWPSNDTDAAVLAIHGAGGSTLAVWGPNVVPGYSFAHRVAHAGRAFVAIDLPGYGNSEATGDLAGHDDYAWVLRQIADHLRAGTYTTTDSPVRPFTEVIGTGFSSGAFLLMLAQGGAAPFDAIVPIAWSHAGWSAAFRSCARGDGPCPETAQERLFVERNTDPMIWRHGLENASGQPPPGTLTLQMQAWSPCLDCQHVLFGAAGDPPALEDAAAANIAVPVLMVLGADDFFVAPSTAERERAVFRSSEDVTVAVYADTGHLVLHHLNHDDVADTIVAWMDERAP